ncbi:MAG: MlaE family lipid ABC transporter permease subunit [Desulfobacteraceae bacterium]|nr:MlaE family lipid ABC transporter permease subunit [Desulfobacteraceae bacterium]
MSDGLPFETQATGERDLRIIFRSPLVYANAASLWSALRAELREGRHSGVNVDLARVDRIDSAGIALLRALKRFCSARGSPVSFENVPSSAKNFLEHFEKEKPLEPSAKPAHISVVSRFGSTLISAATELREFCLFIRTFFATSISLFRSGGRGLRWTEVFYYLQISGANAMLIIFLVSFLLGLVMAYQAAIQLRQFGANIYVADLVSLALTRELAPVFTALVLAGRSGSAFAAEIGTMKVGEEIDALDVMGFNLTEFITIPKVLALMVSGPLLTMWSNLAGIIGGIAVSAISLDLTPYSFMYEVYQILGVADILTGLVKAEVFAVLIALVGCFQGFQTTRSADSVGRQTTSAVVSGIFLIILADAGLTVLFQSIGW